MADPLTSLTKPSWGKNKIKLPDSEKTDKPKPMSGSGGKVLAIGVALLLILGIAAAVYVIKFGNPFARSNTPAPAADDTPLELEVTKPTRTVLNSVTELTVVSNKEVTIDANNRTKLEKIGEKDNKLYYVLRVSSLPIDMTKVTVKFSDAAGNTQDQLVEITRESFALPSGVTAIQGWPNASYTLDGDKYDATVDKQHRLLEDYEPTDLVNLNKDLGLLTFNDASLRAVAARSLKSMLADLATATGDKSVTVASGYRSFTIQMQTYTNNVKVMGEQKTDAVSARPGFSEHQLGTAVDLVNKATDYKITNDFGSTPAGKWLSENSYKYGFILPYKNDQSTNGGYQEESWHFRFTGLPESIQN